MGSGPETGCKEAGSSKADQMLREMDQELEEAKKERDIQSNRSRYMANPWLDFVGWDDHLQKFKSEVMLKYVWPTRQEMTVEEEAAAGVQQESEAIEDEGLLYACYATKRLIKTAMATCEPNIVGRSALEYVNRREVGESKNEKPFYAKHKADSMRKYMDVWVKILRYIWRSSSRAKDDRPPYTLTQDQEEHLARMKKLARAWNDYQDGHIDGQVKKRYQKEMEETCLAFWISMFRHELKGGEYESAIISGLAVLGIDPQTKGWQPATNFTPKLSALVTVTRALVVYQAWLIQEVSRQAGLDTGMTERQAKEEAPSIFESVKKMVNQFMTLTTYGGMPSPMDRILHMRTYGFRIRFNTKATGVVTWPRANTIAINKISFTMDDVRTVAHGLNESVRQRLVRDLLMLPSESSEQQNEEQDDGGDAKLPKLDLAELFDNPAEMTEEWNFLKDPRNKWDVDGQKWMWKRMWNEEEVASRLVKGSLDEVESRDDVRWDDNKVERFFRRVRTFKEELFVLIHLTAGAPARGTEILSIQHQNGQDSRAQRGIFINQGMIAFVTSYHKGYSTSQKVKIIHRYVPKEVGELVVYYLWLVEPFVRQLQVCTKNQYDFTTFLWEPEPEEQLADDEEFEEMAEEEDDNDQEREQIDTRQGGMESSDDVEDQINGEKEQEEVVARNVDGFWGTDKGMDKGKGSWREAR
ncbi:hypothetical protein D6C78_10812 [Aureobasidium pullulans]|uniref:Uncharacterized protein n=1 Tax=Aureobasidium pullulans TaxID=5580 RepID=A0A4T0B3J4_AURPU|nr:hypothetical protein D6C78_10812 [Aureobasidium pullulans]